MSDKPKCKNHGIDQDLFDTLLTAFDNMPAGQHLGVEVRYLGHGKSCVTMLAKNELGNTQGLLQGGIISALCDHAMGTAARTLGFWIVTLEMNINYLLKVPLGSLIVAEGSVVKCGKSIIVGEAHVYNDGELVAKSRGTFYVTGTY